MSQTVTAKIRLSLQIQVDTPNTASRYRNRTVAAQHSAKMALLHNLENPILLTFLGYWQNLTVTVDDGYVDTIPTAQQLIQSNLDVANPALDEQLGFELQVGELCPGQPCTKLPNCSHDCYHQFVVNSVTTSSSGNTVVKPWIVDDGTGVKATVIASLEWTTPSMAAASLSGGAGGSGPTFGMMAMGAAAAMQQSPTARAVKTRRPRPSRRKAR